MANVKVLKAHLGPGGFVQAGDVIDIDIHLHRELARNGIVPPLDGEVMSAPVEGVVLAAPQTKSERIVGAEKPKPEAASKSK